MNQITHRCRRLQSADLEALSWALDWVSSLNAMGPKSLALYTDVRPTILISDSLSFSYLHPSLPEAAAMIMASGINNNVQVCNCV